VRSGKEDEMRWDDQSRLWRSAAAVVSVILCTGIGAAEVFEIQPHGEALVTTDSDGAPVDLQNGSGAGDSTDGRVIRALFTFDLSFLPPGSEVTSAVVHSRIGAVYGDPASLGPLLATRVAETRGAPSVEVQARWATNIPYPSPVQTTGAIEVGADLAADLTSQFRDHFPSPDWSLDPGRAVVRFQFTELNNDNGRDDFLYVQDTWLELDADLPDPITERPVGRHIKRCLPVAASAPGAAGTLWVTELHITARHDASVWLYFTESDTNGTAAFRVRRVDLDMWQTVRYRDVLPELFGLQDTRGWLEIFVTDPDTAITARIANVGGEGSFGQTVPMVEEHQMLRYSEIRFQDSYRRLVNLIMMDADHRINIGLVNLGPTELTSQIIAIAPDGYFLGEAFLDLDPFEHRQIDRLETVIPQTASAGLVALSFGVDDDPSPVYRQGVAVYASRVDNTTGDAVFILP
jgi:hypothetical protein